MSQASTISGISTRSNSGADEESLQRWSKLQCLTGSVVAIVTPMKEDEDKSIDYDALRNLVYWQVESGTKGIVVMGTTGENPTVDDDEYKAIVSAVVQYTREASNGTIPVIAGTGTNSTKSTIARTQLAQSLGSDAALIVTPYYNKPTQDGLIRHYTTIAKACKEFPIILYNVPSRTGCDIIPSTVAELSKIPNIIGTKEASGKFERYSELGKLCVNGFRIFSGEDNQAVPAILSGSGVVGVISVTGNVAPSLVQKACEFALQNEEKPARELHERLLPLHDVLFCEPNPCPAKHILAAKGRIPAGVRMPLLPLSAKYQADVCSKYETAICEQRDN